MAEDASSGEERGSGRIQSLERAFSILEETARRREGITLTDLSRSLGLHTSTLYHLVKTLTALGYLRTGEGDKRYRVGRGVFMLASACHDEIETAEIVTPHLQELARQTGESTHYAIWERGQALILVRASGPRALQMNERAGTLRPVYCTAIGKALLTGLKGTALESRLAAESFERFTPTTLEHADALRREVEKAAAEGVAFDDCEYNPEVRCMAAPVRDFRGGVVGAIGFSGPVWRLSFSDMAGFIPLLKRIADDLSRELGHVSEPGRAASA